MTDARTWRTSTFSGSQGECVRVCNTIDAVGDSKSPTRVLDMPTLPVFITMVKAGHWASPVV